MTVSSTSNRKTFTGDGVTVAFGTSPVVFFDQDDLTVYKVVTATGAATLQTITTDYTVTGGSGSTGTVTAVVAPAVGETYVIVRELDLVQEVDFVNNEATDAEVAEDALDKLTMMCQQLYARVSRAFTLADSDVSGASTTLPTPVATTLIGWNSAATALQNYATSALGVALTTPYTLTLLAAVSAAAARVVLGFPAITTGKFHIGVAADTLAALSFPSQGAFLINGKITRTVGSSALTIAVKTLADANPSAADPVLVLMPTVTSNVFDGGYAIRTITAALSTVISSGSTLGHASTIAGPVYTYLIDNAGTLELATSNKFFGGASVQSTTAEGGAGAADSATTLYSTTARSNVATVCLQRWKSTQTTAGTWAATTGEVQLYPFPYKAPTTQTFTSTGANTYTKPWDMLWAEVEGVAGGASGGGTSDSATRGTSGGGGSGSRKRLDASAVGPTETATVGAGGTAVTGNNNGNTGGTTSFGAHFTCAGGVGGLKSNGGVQIGSLGGTSSGGDLNVPGGASGSNYVSTGVSVPGVGAFAWSSVAINVNSVGIAYGAGGTVENNTGGSSGAGAPGIIVAREHYA